MYVCGITPYDATHMGHAATYVAFDLVNRYWRDLGHEVHYVQNVTDIDDPLLERAVATGQDWRELARSETALFAEDMEALNVLPPRDYIGAVESIPSVVAVDRPAARRRGRVRRGRRPVLHDVRAARASARSRASTRRRCARSSPSVGETRTRPGKRTPLDCMLWQAARPDEPAWDTELGHGRPGWHIECTAIALDHLGMGFDVQGGGSDLAFPHHEMCSPRPRSPPARPRSPQHFVHAGMVGYEGHKMSKSRGNLVFVSRLRQAGVSTRGRSAWPCWHTTTAATGSGPPPTWSGRSAATRPWRTAVRAAGGPRSTRCWPRPRRGSPTTSTRRARWRSSTPGPPGRPTGPARDADAPEQVRVLLDTLLGVDLS